MNYIGSKRKLSDFIFENIQATIKRDIKELVFCELFAGTGVVGNLFKPHVKKVISNDLEYYSYVLNRNSIGNTQNLDSKLGWIEKLNKLPLQKGFMFKNYSKSSGRLYFSDTNASKIDTIRAYIEELYQSKKIDEDTYFFLLASLLQSSDKVANTASIYAAFLKELKPSAKTKLVLKPAIYQESHQENEVYNEDANTLISKISGDILYLDPPYNVREYGLNYHILNTIAKFDSFEPRGKGGLREYKRSNFCKIPKAAFALESLIQKADFEYIFLSYNNEGLLKVSEIKKIMQKYGEYTLLQKPYRRFAINQKHKQKVTNEYLHVIKK